MDYNQLCYGCMEPVGSEAVCSHCGYNSGTAPESALHLPPGTMLENKYLLGRALGQGGFGITYLAWDLKLNVKLAIKEYMPQEVVYRTPGQSVVTVYKQTLSPQFSYGLEKYLEEARILARFAGHPSIVSVRDFFETNNTAYIVMEYIDGITLKSYLANRKEPLPFMAALNIFMPVLDALKEIHAVGILHRDISPDNLLIDSRNRVVLIDFGAARQAVSEQSRSLSVIMKQGYSPEEQYHSKGLQGPWTDIYSVAASIYNSITGVTPPESLSRLSEDSLISPSEHGITIEIEFEKILLKALSVKAVDRYPAVEALQDDIFSLVNPTDMFNSILLKNSSFTKMEYNGGFYNGAIENGLPHGKGILTMRNNVKYVGEFQNGLFHNQGHMTWPDGTTYSGDFLNGGRSGLGSMIWIDNTRYVGNFSKGWPDGMGSIIWPNGAHYHGQIKKNIKHGCGIMFWNDETHYTGEFKNNLPDGEGTMRWKNGQLQKGIWQSGIFIA